MTIPEREVDSLYTTVTPIQYPNESSHATGFFYHSNGTYYLITNHHAVTTANGETIADSIRILFRPSLDTSKIEFQDIQLTNDDGNPVWLEHPSGSSVDLVAIPLDVDLAEKQNVALSQEHFLPEDINIMPGEQSMILGYPIKGKSPYLPVLRSALVSSPYGHNFQDLPCFATDANLHSGTSGSPVFTTPSPWRAKGDKYELTGGKFYFLGIHSATVFSNHETEEGPLNLNITWYSELLEEIVEK